MIFVRATSTIIAWIPASRDVMRLYKADRAPLKNILFNRCSQFNLIGDFPKKLCYGAVVSTWRQERFSLLCRHLVPSKTTSRSKDPHKHAQRSRCQCRPWPSAVTTTETLFEKRNLQLVLTLSSQRL